MPNFGGMPYPKSNKSSGMTAKSGATTSAGGSPFSITGPGHQAAAKASTNAGTFNSASKTENYPASGSATVPGGAKTV
jgi:hypothetical protein